MAEFTETSVEEKDFPYEKEEAYLQTYLNKIKSNTGDGFKRVLVSPLRYAGGKSKAVGLILDNLPKLREKKIVSPFFGGGSFELCLSQYLGIEVVGYDVFGMLTNFWDVLINHKTAFVAALKEFKINADEFTKNRHILLSYWDKIKPATLVYNTKKVVELMMTGFCRRCIIITTCHSHMDPCFLAGRVQMKSIPTNSQEEFKN